MKRILVYVLTLGALASILPSCHRQSVPKPYGYFRIAIPDTAYNSFDWKGYPYSFRLSQNAYVEVHKKEGEVYWIDIQYPSINATIHCSYKRVRNNLRTLSRDAQEFLYSHSTVASAIPAQEYTDDLRHVYGLYYELHGNTATPIQFYLTDSVEHFFRGSVYCNCVPNQDSLAPIYEYLRKDVRVIMESMKWYK
jgi:gliding motility-associated lipoprotein GldD